MRNAQRAAQVGDRVRLTTNGPEGTIMRFPRKQTGEPPLATVAWDTGKTGIHDRRNLTVVERTAAQDAS